MTSDELLDQLSIVGRPRLQRMDDGTWHAAIEFPAPQGVTAKVASDFNHATHREALACVVERLGKMRDMVAQLPDQRKVT